MILFSVSAFALDVFNGNSNKYNTTYVCINSIGWIIEPTQYYLFLAFTYVILLYSNRNSGNFESLLALNINTAALSFIVIDMWWKFLNYYFASTPTYL